MAAELLPSDVLELILRRLTPSPRSLAACRRVCKEWRAVVDAHCPPPHPDLLPLSLAGIFLAQFFFEHEYLPDFFGPRDCRHKAGRRIFPKIDYVDDARTPDLEVIDHCNGLLLMYQHVVNPATRRWPCCDEYLVFDPTVSPHYEVFSIPGSFLFNPDSTVESVVRQLEWPPSPFVVNVYSSATGRWEKRSLARRGEAAGTVADVLHSPPTSANHLYGVTWRGVLYVQMNNGDVIRISLSDDKYQVIKSPSDIDMNHSPYIYLGKSEKTVYCASIEHYKNHQRLQVFLLHELHRDGDDPIEWILIHDVSLDQIMADFRWNPEAAEPWIQHDMDGSSHNEEEMSKDDESPGWNSEDDSIVYTADMVGWGTNGSTCIVGFHPFREIIFLYSSCWLNKVRAYHLHNSKVEVLGTYSLGGGDEIGQSFPYTPCWIGDLS
uniref:F-box domain-containing protein n=1 Tax=Leersia perrieri TaxID=77586 RepID=A0A0D9XE59_9ORYZ